MYPAQIIYQQSFVVLFAVPVLVAYALVDLMEQAVSKKSIEHCWLNCAVYSDVGLTYSSWM
jgi:hypothetical protein